MATDLSRGTAASPLHVVLPDWCALRWQHAIVGVTYVALFVFYSYLPVSSPDTWAAVATGQTSSVVDCMLESRVPSVQGMRHAQLGWASGWIIARLHDWGGPALLSIVFAVAMTVALILWNVVFYLLSRRCIAVVGSLAIAVLNVHDLDGLHGRTLGLSCLALLFLLIVSTDRRRAGEMMWSEVGLLHWGLTGLLFCVWANLDVGAVCGILVLIVFALDRLVRGAVESGWREALADREFQSRVWLTEAAVVATFMNPLGVGWWSALLWWPDNMLARLMGGWSSPTLASWVGVWIMTGWGIWFVAALTRLQRPALWSALPACLMFVTAVHATAFAWFVPVMTTSIVALFSAPRSRWQEAVFRDRADDQPNDRLRFAFTLLTLLAIWLGFCFSPAGVLLGGTPRSTNEIVGRTMPHAVASYLHDLEPNHLVLAPMQWTDYLLANTRCRYCTTGTAGRVPTIVARDSAMILAGEHGWKAIADKYALDCIVADKSQHATLITSIRRGGTGWSVIHQDALAVVVGRDSHEWPQVELAGAHADEHM